MPRHASSYISGFQRQPSKSNTMSRGWACSLLDAKRSDADADADDDADDDDDDADENENDGMTTKQ